VVDSFHDKPSNKFCQNLNEESNNNIELELSEQQEKLECVLREVVTIKSQLTGLENRIMDLML